MNAALCWISKSRLLSSSQPAFSAPPAPHRRCLRWGVRTAIGILEYAIAPLTQPLLEWHYQYARRRRRNVSPKQRLARKRGGSREKLSKPRRLTVDATRRLHPPPEAPTEGGRGGGESYPERSQGLGGESYAERGQGSNIAIRASPTPRMLRKSRGPEMDDCRVRGRCYFEMARKRRWIMMMLAAHLIRCLPAPQPDRVRAKPR